MSVLPCYVVLIFLKKKGGRERESQHVLDCKCLSPLSFVETCPLFVGSSHLLNNVDEVKSPVIPGDAVRAACPCFGWCG